MNKNKSNTVENILLKLIFLIPLFIMIYFILIADESWREPLIKVTVIGYIAEIFMLKFWVYRKIDE